jgi:hypothetical protein
MKDENAKFQAITSHIDPNSYTTLNTKFKRYIFPKYNEAAYYNKEDSKSLFSRSTLNIKEYDPVRMIYNTLVGLNHALFYCLGGRSEDPSEEIVHWTKVLLYWEILARLLKQHGVGPMSLASNLFLSDLWGRRKDKK